MMAKTKKPSDFKENWVGRLKRKSHELLKGETAYISEERAKEMRLQHMIESYKKRKAKTEAKTKAETKPKQKPKESVRAQGIRSQAMLGNSMTKEEYEKFGIK
jgi:hypothetical protein